MVEWRVHPCDGAATGCDEAERDATQHREAVTTALRTGLQFLSQAMLGFSGRPQKALVVIAAAA
jgi:hypothetical protein